MTSPVPTKDIADAVVMLTFPDAMREVINGKKVTRLEWKDNDIYCLLDANRLRIHNKDGINYILEVSDGDMLAIDWVVIE